MDSVNKLSKFKSEMVELIEKYKVNLYTEEIYDDSYHIKASLDDAEISLDELFESKFYVG